MKSVVKESPQKVLGSKAKLRNSSPVPPPAPTRPKTVNITVKGAKASDTPSLRRKSKRTPSTEGTRRRQNGRSSSRARSTTPEFTVTPSSPQSTKLGRRSVFREKSSFFKRRSNAVGSLDEPNTGDENKGTTRESRLKKRNLLNVTKSHEDLSRVQHTPNGDTSTTRLKHLRGSFAAINGKINGVLKTSNGNSGDNMKGTDINDTKDNKDHKTPKTPRRAIKEKNTGVLKTSNGNGGDNMKGPGKNDTTDNKDSKTPKTPRRGRRSNNENTNNRSSSLRRSPSKSSLKSRDSVRFQGDEENDDFLENDEEEEEEEEIKLAVSPRFNWRDVDGVSKPGATITDIAEDEQLIRRNLMALHRAVNQKDRILLSQLERSGIDMTLPLKGVTALSLTLYHKYKEMFVAVLDALKRTKQTGRAVNVRSVDKASRREPPIVTAARMGLTNCVSLLLTCLPELDIERKDGQGQTALWHAVKEQRDDIVALLVDAGARLFYEGDHDTPCPLQLAVRCTLTTATGREIAKYLIRHGANVNYHDHALRNALYWTVYGCAPELTLFLLEAGAKVKPYSWLQDDALPNSYLKDKAIHTKISEARDSPASLLVLSRAVLRERLIEEACGKSIYPLVKKMSVAEDMKNVVSLQAAGRSRPSSRLSVSKKLEKLNNETNV